MVFDGPRGYIQAVAGLSEVTRQRAGELAQALLASSSVAVPPGAGAVAGQVAGLAEDILATARTNRALLLDLVRTEVERTVQSLGLASPAEVDRLRRQVASLEGRLEKLESTAPPAPRRPTAKKSTAKKSTAKKSTAKKTAARKSTA
jgi:trigger factor